MSVDIYSLSRREFEILTIGTFPAMAKITHAEEPEDLKLRGYSPAFIELFISARDLWRSQENEKRERRETKRAELKEKIKKLQNAGMQEAGKETGK